MTEPDRWYAMPVLCGRLIRLEPLAVEHASGYLAAAGTGRTAEEVFRWLNPPGGGMAQPVTVADAETHILDALAARARGERFAYAQVDAGTGEFAGTTSYYEVTPAARAIAIGHTWLGKRWWRTGHNTEAKLLLLGHAFETLAAVRVVWHTDIHNVRSQDAIVRLGAMKEGVLRKHRLRRDGSWRDTVQYAMTDEDWPAVRDRLATRLVQG
ncbi:MAG: GNAT family N-acetyltransferase [Actinomycetota bacterium]|nr:GNAT family N-acetyltransferase [Actinomycetota bacterium]